ncbi:MAG TPA: hypothetical protein DD473_08620 [Planctomycetaceae bacterium]|nr:hypothetical protein [Planctomycetaceae bacterium]
MSNMNSQCESQINALVDLCCETLQGDQSNLDQRKDKLIKSLVMSGYTRHEGPSLQAELQSRIKEKCPDPAIHRGSELAGVTNHLQEIYEEVVRFETKLPHGRSKPRAANISSATND